MHYISINGERVKEIRLKRKLSQNAVAKYVGVSKQAISRIEQRGKDAKIQDNHFEALVTVLQTNQLYLTDEVGFDFDGEVVQVGEQLLKKPFLKGGPYGRVIAAYMALDDDHKLLMSKIFFAVNELPCEKLQFILEFCDLYTKNQ